MRTDRPATPPSLHLLTCSRFCAIVHCQHGCGRPAVQGTRFCSACPTEFLAGHADAAHWGEVDGGCDRCVTLAADAGFDLRRDR